MKYVILGRDGCNFCDLAAAMLPDAIVLKGPDIHTIVKEGGFGTFPQIFHKGKHIGGYQDLLAYRPDCRSERRHNCRAAFVAKHRGWPVRFGPG